MQVWEDDTACTTMSAGSWEPDSPPLRWKLEAPKSWQYQGQGKGQGLTFPEGHADSAQLGVSPPGPSSSSSCAPWSNGSGYRQTSSRPHQ